MQDLKPKSTKKERKTYINQSPWESMLDLGRGVKDSLIDEVAKEGLYVAEDQVLHPKESHKHDSGGELQAGQEIDFSSVQEKVAEVTSIGREFTAEIINAGKKANQETSHDLQVKYNEILIELKSLGESSKELKEQVEILTVEQAPEEVGVYHVSFVEKLLSSIQEFRESVDDGLAWFKALRIKKASRQYGALAKKGGTSFTLANERTVATQSG